MPDAQAAQAAVATDAASQLRGMLPSVDPQAQWQQLVAWLFQLVQRSGRASATLAVHEYADARRAAGVTGSYRPFPAEPPPLAQVTRTAGWALHPVLQPVEGATADLTVVHDNLAAAVERLILDVGRDTITGNVEADRKAKGWARLTEPDACSWCALLATRGAVYKSERSAATKADGEGYHTNCRCHVEAVFNVYEPPAQVRAWESQYLDATKGVSGSKAKQIAWRRAYEGRTNVPAAPGQPQQPQEGQQ